MSTQLPGGTVTFLFTDIEGSTRMLAASGAEAYAEALGEHRRLFRACVAAHGGVEVDTQGDAFFCVFRSAREAVACAQEAQERFETTPIRVRMGLHSGEALVAGDHYVGLDVHRGARVAAAAHGGQVLLSPATVGLLEPGSFPLRDLGEHRLKDLSAPLRLHQLGDRDFPSLKTLQRTNLPVPATPFVGREREVEALVGQVVAGGARLYTLTGPGGTGKTRLALQAAGGLAEEFPGGVFWVPLAALRDAALVPSAVAQALGVEEQAGAEVAEAVAQSLAAPTLLLLDNCEHLLDGVAAIVSPLVRSGADLCILATSREPLALGGERVLPVEPLARGDAVALFHARAAAAGGARVGDDVAALVCDRLDYLPLAIELAAARTATLPPEALLERLTHRLELLRGPRDADERQRTLRSTIAWSYDLLDEMEQRLLARLSVFAGGATLDAVEEITGADVERLESLVEKSLVRLTGDRYWMLETIREFAAEQLADDERAEVEASHGAWFARLAVQAGSLSHFAAARAWIERLEADVDNLRVAFPRALAAEDPAAPTLAATLAELHEVRGRHAESEEVVRRALDEVEEPLLAARLHRILADARTYGRDNAGASAALTRAEELLGPPRDDPAWRHEWLEVKLAWASQHYWFSDLDALERDVEGLRPHVEASGTPEQRADFLHVELQSRLRQERYALSAETEQLARDAYAVGRATDDWGADFQLGFALLWRGLLDEAEEHLRRGRAEARVVGDVLCELRCLVYGAIARRKRGDVEAARALDREIEAFDEQTYYRGLVTANRAWLAWRDGDLDAVERWGRAALEDWSRSGRRGPTIFQWTARFPLLALAVARGDLAAAAEHARVLVDPVQQPLPEDLAEALRAEAYGEALALAREGGYV